MGERRRCTWAESHPLLTVYHDEEYGVALETDADLFERLMLEVNQAGLSWLTILKKRDGFREAFDAFDIDRVADYGEFERSRLLQDANIIRNRLKIDAAIHNANVVQSLRDEHGSFKSWLDGQTCESLEEWVKLFRGTFKFMGPEIVNEFLMSTGYISIPHDAGCWLNGNRSR